MLLLNLFMASIESFRIFLLKIVPDSKTFHRPSNYQTTKIGNSKTEINGFRLFQFKRSVLKFDENAVLEVGDRS